MKKNIIYFMAMLFSSTLFSCFQDKGNYDYAGKETIEINGIKNEYSRIAFSSSIEIEPTAKSNKDGDISYMWIINLGGIDQKRDTISREKDLNYSVNIPQGIYTTTFAASNDKTGYTEYKTFSLNVTTDFSLAWYVQKELDGNTELDLFNLDGNIAENLFQKIHGKSHIGKPMSLRVVPGFRYTVGTTKTTKNILTVSSEKEISLLSADDLSQILTHDNMFFGHADPNEIPYKVYFTSSYVGYLSDKGLYYQNTMMSISGRFGAPISIEKGARFSKHSITTTSYEQGVFYDELNQRFLYLTYNGALSAFTDNDKNDIPTDLVPNNTGCKMLYFGRCKSTPLMGYALMENTTTGKKYMYDINTQWIALPDIIPCSPITKITELPSTLKLTEATIYGHNENVACTYFTNNNVLNLYDNISGNEILNIKSFPSDEKISFIKHIYWNFKSDIANNFDYLAVGTTVGGNYKIYFYNILAGRPNGEPVKIYEGKGIATEVQYFTPKMNSYDNNSYQF